MAHQNDEEETFGERLARVLRDHGISQTQLASESGQTDSQISEILAGSLTRLTITPVLKILKGLIKLHAVNTRVEAEDLLVLYFTDKKKPYKKLEELGQDGIELLIELEKPKYGKPLIGRDEAEEDICKLLKGPEIRLLTLKGAPGIGKTSLAENIIDVLNEQHAFDNVCLVRLESISAEDREADREAIVTAIAREFRLEDSKSASLLDRLITHLRGKHMLLVLDNCEHLIQACAELAETLLRTCQHLTLLTTSTERLRIEVGVEEVYPVVPLLYPDPDDLPPIERLRDYSAIQLFETCRRKIKRGYVITADNAHAAAQICTLLDGHTLAIILAAGVESLTEQEIVVQLDDCLTVLVDGSRTGPKRHESIRAVIEWRYILLSEAEKLLLQRLSVFRGGWTLKIAKMVCVGDGLEEKNIIEIHENLKRKSLIEMNEKTGRRWLLEPIRQYADEKLRASGKAEEIHKQHLIALARSGEEAIQTTLEPTKPLEKWLNFLAVEYDNLRTALRWCLEKQYNRELSVLLALWLFGYWITKGLWTEGRSWMTEALAAADETKPTPVYAVALAVAAQLAFRQGDHKQASLLYEKCLAACKEIDDKLTPQTIQMLVSGDTLAMLSFIEDTKLIAIAPLVLLDRAFESLKEQNYAEARALAQQSLQQYETQDDKHGEARCFLLLGDVDLQEGNYESAQTYYKKGLTLYRWLGHIDDIARSLARMGRTMLLLTSYKEGAAYLKESIELCLRLGDKRLIYMNFVNLAVHGHIEGRVKQTVILLGSADALADSIKLMPTARVSTLNLNTVVGIRKQLGEQAFNALWFEGYNITFQKAVANAYSILNSYIESEEETQE